jgi:hypothetical protein
MIQIPALTDDILAELSASFPGCDFGDINQRAFLLAAEACDVQAVPGNGKTTLLAAKLALLSGTWRSRTEGVCVISHTNAARDEVEKKLAAHPLASAFLGYPHFIGTVTAFIDRYLALPYLRGLGWSVHRIDDDVFAALARARYGRKRTLRASAARNQNQVDRWVTSLELADDFTCDPAQAPNRLKVRNRGNRQPGPHTASGVELEELKAELVNAGLYRFGDMTAIAHQALARYPALISRLRRRFPLVMLDEAQDTHGAQLALLDTLFGQEVAYQRMGDQNQTLYEDPEIPLEGYWRAPQAIALNHSRRFGPEIAAFVSRLTVRSPQQITGVEGRRSRRALFLFDEASIGRVLPAYAAEVRAHWGGQLTANPEIWAVASRHRTYHPRGEWPKSLVDYCPDYRTGIDDRRNPENFCAAMRQASIMLDSSKPPSDVLELIGVGIADLLRRHGLLPGETASPRNVWRTLAARDPALPLRVRRLVLDKVLKGHAAWMEADWQAFCAELQAILGIEPPGPDGLATFLEFSADGAAKRAPEPQARERTIVEHEGVRVRLGSIHSVKGRTLDAVLIVESEVWRSPARSDQVIDLTAVLPHGFGIAEVNFGASAALLSAATNIFVAASRPREILCLAMRKPKASAELLAAAMAQGWLIRDLTAAA